MFTDLGEALQELGYGAGASRRELISSGLSIRMKKERARPNRPPGSRTAEIMKAKAKRRTKADKRARGELEDAGILGAVNVICWNRGILHPDGNADYVGLLGHRGTPALRTPEAHEARVDLAHYLRRNGWTYKRTHRFFARRGSEVMRGLRGRDR